MWPDYVKERIRDTYMYFGASIGVTAASAAAIFRSPAMMNIVMRQGWIALGVSIAAMIGSGMLVRSIPYQEGFGAKQLAWLGHCGVIGAVIAPMCLLGGPILMRYYFKETFIGYFCTQWIIMPTSCAWPIFA